MYAAPEGRRRPRSLGQGLVDTLGDRIRDGRIAPGGKLPSEAEIQAEFGVSRTVVREAISKLQAARLIETRHGIGSFALVADSDPAVFRIPPEQFATLRDVIAVLELRIGVETEAAGLAALRRNDANLREMRVALDAFAVAVEDGRDAVALDFQFHCEVARATQNVHFAELMTTLGPRIIPRARLEDPQPTDESRRAYLLWVNREHESIFSAIASGDSEAARAAMRTHLANSRERRRQANANGLR